MEDAVLLFINNVFESHHNQLEWNENRDVMEDNADADVELGILRIMQFNEF